MVSTAREAGNKNIQQGNLPESPEHALRILADAKSWGWPITERIKESGKTGGNFKAVSAQLLYWLIVESQKLGGIVLNQFWLQLENCHPLFKQNSELKHSS